MRTPYATFRRRTIFATILVTFVLANLLTFDLHQLVLSPSLSAVSVDGSLIEACFKLNSQEWLNATRFGNAVDLDDDFVRGMMDQPRLWRSLADTTVSSSFTGLLEQTLSHPQSLFVKANDTNIDRWTTRFVYWAIYYHQHRAARAEWLERHRQSPSCQAVWKARGIGSYDFECPSAKLIAIELEGVGLGANTRAGLASAMILGLATDRVVVVVNHPDRPWPLASCPRRDYQCFFLPLTPCVLTQQDIDDAYQMSIGDANAILLGRSLPSTEQQEHRVWWYRLNFRPVSLAPPVALHRLYNYSQLLLPQLAMDEKMLHSAADAMLSAPRGIRRQRYAAEGSKVHFVTALYFLRPRAQTRAVLDRIAHEIVPENLDVERSFGLPVRASDKCRVESDCLSFAQYMQVADELWAQHAPLTNAAPTILFTTESSDMVEEQQSYWFSPNRSTSYSIVANPLDRLPSSGKISEALGKNLANLTADEAMIGALSSLQLQLLARVSAVNCCSNFHTLLADFLSSGCGAAQSSHVQCLSDMKDPELRVCCAWRPKCKQLKERQLAQRVVLGR